eukprot:c14722_g1_i1.p1 GENE.c14722_g1_i1~~c14722_g1_i1.p1  ORF type:complete len:147 (+),score=28.22 c14722_g1_i1:611-1051(+)
MGKILDAHRTHDSVLEIKRYPPWGGVVPSSQALERFADHTDLSTVTLLAETCPGGLEVFDENQQAWVSSRQGLREGDHDDSVLMNTGALLSRWTETLPSTRHRVVAQTNQPERISAVFFFTPEWHATVPDGQGGEELVGDLMPLVV